MRPLKWHQTLLVLCVGKGNACRTFGLSEDAIAAFRLSIATNPYHAEPYWSLANLKTFKFEQERSR